MEGRQITIRLALAASGLLLAIGAAEFALRLMAGSAVVSGDAAAVAAAPADGGAGIMHREGLDGTGLGGSKAWNRTPEIRTRR